jgi:N-succinyldiaminopimelate aminotransferase
VKSVNPRLAPFGTTIFAEMSALAIELGAVNLGQGFPDTDGPRAVLDAAIDCINGGVNQYPPGPGMKVLRDAIAAHQLRFYGLNYDPEAEVLVTAGATEALAGALLGLLEPGDEVVVFEPMYDSYQACIALAGARAVPITLQPPSFRPDLEAVKRSITPRTKILLVNSPHNPTGMLLTDDERVALAEIAAEHDLIVVADEVYEHLVFDGLAHRSLAEFGSLRDRTLVISSGGKTFNTTGWKIGWICGPAELVAAARAAKQFLTYVNGAPFQPAIAVGLGLGDDYFASIAAELQERRDELVPALSAVGFRVFDSSATYFVTADCSPVCPDGDGMNFVKRLATEAGVVAIPNAVFYSPENRNKGRSLVRFAFCKRREVVAEAASRLRNWKP